MPTRAYKAGGLKNNRTASGGSSKMGLNLHFTQKEPAHPPAGRAATKPHNGHAEAHRPRSRDAHVRTSSAIRLDKGKEKEQPTPHPNPVRRTSSGKGHPRPRRPKTDFSIASPSTEESDEDEWVSSAAPSGATTPRHKVSDDESSDEDSEDAPIVAATKVQPKVSQKAPSGPAPPKASTAPLAGAPVHQDFADRQPSHVAAPTTPPGPSRRRSPSPQSHGRAPPPPRTSAADSTEQSRPLPVDTSPTTPPSVSPESKRGSQSATTSPRIRTQSTHRTYTRPPSVLSMVSRPDLSLRPHPLIRAHSHNRDAPAPRVSALTATSTPVSTSPPQSIHANGRLSSSPESVNTSDGFGLTSPVLARAPQTALSSLAPAPEFSVPSVRVPFPSGERSRTLSTASGASLAALASLANHNAHASHRAPQLPTMVHFAPVPPPGALEGLHPLLPQPYLGQHLSVLNVSDPMKDSYGRVMRAKHGW